MAFVNFNWLGLGLSYFNLLFRLSVFVHSVAKHLLEFFFQKKLSSNRQKLKTKVKQSLLRFLQASFSCLSNRDEILNCFFSLKINYKLENLKGKNSGMFLPRVFSAFKVAASGSGKAWEFDSFQTIDKWRSSA